MEAVYILLALLFLLLPVVALIVAISSRNMLQRRVEVLEKQVRRLRAALDDGAPRTPAAARADVAPPAPTADLEGEIPPHAVAEPIGPSPEEHSHDEPAGMINRETTRRPRPAPAVRREARPARPKRPSRTNQEWEALVGGRVLNLIGAVALIIGIGFFLKYAFDKNWISETVRAMIGGGVGIGLLVLGALSNRKGYKVFSQGLVGAGIATLYLSIYAAFNYYHIGLGQTPAFIMMAAVTVIAFHQAFAYDSFAVALLGLIGGFLTPLLLSTGTANEVGLFTYLAILDAGLLAVATRKRAWDALVPLSFLATAAFYVGWFDEYYLPADRVTTIIFITVFWALYYASGIIAQNSQERRDRTVANAVGIANMVFYYAALYMLLEDRKNPWLVGATVALGSAYLLPAVVPALRPKAGSFFAERNLIAAMFLFALAAQLAPFADATEYLRPVVWGAMGLAFFSIGTRWGIRSMWVGALILFLLVLFGAEWYDIETPLIQIPFLVIHRIDLVLGLLALCLAASTQMSGGIGEESRKAIGSVLRIGLVVTIFILLYHLVDHQVEGYAYPEYRPPAGAPYGKATLSPPRLYFLQAMWKSLVWVGYGLLLAWRGIRARRALTVYSGLAVLAIAAILGAFAGLTYVPIESFTPLLNIRALVLATAAVAGIVVMRMLRSAGDIRPANYLRAIIEVAVVMIIFDLLTVETNDLFGGMIRDASGPNGVATAASQVRITYLENMKQIALSGVWLLYSALLMVVGIARSIRLLRIIAFGLFGLTILKIFIYDLSFLDTLYRIFSFIGLGVILLLVSFLYGRYRDLIFGAKGESPAGKEETMAEGDA